MAFGVVLTAPVAPVVPGDAAPGSGAIDGVAGLEGIGAGVEFGAVKGAGLGAGTWGTAGGVTVVVCAYRWPFRPLAPVIWAQAAINIIAKRFFRNNPLGSGDMSQAACFVDCERYAIFLAQSDDGLNALTATNDV